MIITSIHNLNRVSALWHLSGERWPFGEQRWRLPRVTLSDQNIVNIRDNVDDRDYLMMMIVVI